MLLYYPSADLHILFLTQMKNLHQDLAIINYISLFSDSLI